MIAISNNFESDPHVLNEYGPYDSIRNPRTNAVCSYAIQEVRMLKNIPYSSCYQYKTICWISNAYFILHHANGQLDIPALNVTCKCYTSSSNAHLWCCNRMDIICFWLATHPLILSAEDGDQVTLWANPTMNFHADTYIQTIYLWERICTPNYLYNIIFDKLAVKLGLCLVSNCTRGNHNLRSLRKTFGRYTNGVFEYFVGIRFIMDGDSYKPCHDDDFWLCVVDNMYTSLLL